jgi:hypothetical protein
MGKLIVVIAIAGGIAFAWHKGWIAQWFDRAVDTGIQGVQDTQRAATKVRPIDGAAPEKK